MVLDSDGTTVGFGHVWAVPPDEVRGFVRVRPSAKGRGVGAALLSWLEPRAREIAGELSLNQNAILTVTSWAQDGDAAALLARAGLSPLRHFLQMRIDLGRGLPEPVWPDGLEPHSFSSGPDDAELFAAFREAFADHWGNTEVDEAQWWSENRDAPNAGFDPALWVVVREGRTIGGFSICREREDDGETIGWISLVGVQPPWRGRGLGEALLVHSLHAFHRRGRRRAALNVDVDNTTGALRLYTKVGMVPTPAFTVWSKTLDKEDPSDT
ncbi:MAG TPA: GNAT family N-acetyltransferase [Gaiellaceae bacterium]